MLVTHNIRHFRSGEGVRVVRPMSCSMRGSTFPTPMWPSWCARRSVTHTCPRLTRMR